MSPEGQTDSCRSWHHAAWGGVRDGLAEDLKRLLNRPRDRPQARLGSAIGAICTPQFGAMLFYRVAHALHLKGHAGAAAVVSRANLLLHKIDLSPCGCIGPGCFVPHPVGVSFAARAGRGLTLFALSVCGPGQDGRRPPIEALPTLGDNVLVGAHSVLQGAIHVGDDVRIGYAVRLERDVPANCLVVSRSMRVAVRRPGGSEEHPAGVVAIGG